MTKLTREKLLQQTLERYAKDMENLLYELNAQVIASEPKPVAWWHDRGDVVDLNVSGHGTPLYFAPPKKEWVGLTDEEYEAIRTSGEFGKGSIRFKNIFNAIEAKLKEKNNG